MLKSKVQLCTIVCGTRCADDENLITGVGLPIWTGKLQIMTGGDHEMIRLFLQLPLVFHVFVYSLIISLLGRKRPRSVLSSARGRHST